ncbi:hypothetical protein QBC37DRAFT_449430 [Rhypophila decipiens]|uniref:Uncharacterized protein n=1 Tax=Rhypophila decipiens TaxID=261697 RepID=A0AAN6Y5L9_9PEZI|nr:hypothetical protein QBC37DRAFT_449430 [Rhypophila decipiens]
MREGRTRGIVAGMHKRSCMPPDPPYRFLRHNPIYCGLWLLHLRLGFHAMGVRYAAPPAGIMHVTQLYHALRQEKLLPQDLVWRDIETSITNWAKGKRLGKGGRPADNLLVAVNNQNRRNMNMLGLLSSTMASRIVDATSKGLLSTEVIEAILEKGRERVIRDSKGFLRADKKEDNEKRTNALVPAVTTPAYVLRQLAFEIEAEAKFSEVFGEDMIKFLPPTEQHLTFLVGYVFVTASGHLAELIIKLPPGSENKILLDGGAEEVTQFLKEGNNAAKVLDAEKAESSEAEKKAADAAFEEYRDKDTLPGYEEGMRQMGRDPYGPDSDDEESGNRAGLGDSDSDWEPDFEDNGQMRPEAAQLMSMLRQMLQARRGH